VKKHADRPLVTAHFAMTADGKTNSVAFTPEIFASPAGKSRVREVQAGADAVLVGRSTVAANFIGLSPQPLRVMISNAGDLDPDWMVFNCSDSPIIVFSTRQMPVPLRTEIARRAELFLFSRRSVDLRKSLEILRVEFGVRRLACEGGGTLLRSLAALDLVDSICLTVVPVVSGGRLAPTLTGLPGAFLNPPREFEIVRQSVIAGECFLELRRKKDAE
jgi:riboflavin biosynthesis pyrimidine reductase